MPPVERTTRSDGPARARAGAGSGSAAAASGAASVSTRGVGGGLGRLGLAPAACAGRRRRLRLGLVDDRLAPQVAAVGQPADAVGRRVVDARRVALHPDLELFGEIQHDLVVDAELSGELVDPDLLGGQSQIRPYCSPAPDGADPAPLAGRLHTVSHGVLRCRCSSRGSGAPARTPRRLTAWSKHAGRARHTARLPDPAPAGRRTRLPSGRRAIRSSSSGAALRPHPTQLRSGCPLTDGPFLLLARFDWSPPARRRRRARVQAPSARLPLLLQLRARAPRPSGAAAVAALGRGGGRRAACRRGSVDRLGGSASSGLSPTAAPRSGDA